MVRYNDDRRTKLEELRQEALESAVAKSGGELTNPLGGREDSVSDPVDEEDEYEVKDISDEWRTADEAVRAGSDTSLDEDYFTDLNDILRQADPDYLTEVASEGFSISEGGQFRFREDQNVRSGVNGGYQITGMPEEDELDMYGEALDAVEAITSMRGPERIMAFTMIAEEEDPIEQKTIYDSVGYAQPTVSLLTDEWEEEGLLEKHDDGSVELTEKGDETYSMVQKIERGAYNFE